MTNYMQMALDLALKGKPSVSPNPFVGCVIEKDSKIVGAGWHKGVGFPHAEAEALQEAGEHSIGANVYVNLEPCCHFGRNPPCVDALIRARVCSVHIPCLDPNPLVNGQGVEKLRQAGIAVHVGAEVKKAQQLNEMFFHYIVQQIPFVIAKWAMTLDGKIATRNFDSKWITGIAARQDVHKLRQEVDGILVGVGTIVTDNPQLTPHLLPNFQNYKVPRRIVLDPAGDAPLTSTVFQCNPENTLVVTTPKASLGWQEQLKALGVTVWVFEPSGSEGTINLKELLQQLGKLSISSLLVEGGARTLGAFFKESLVNKIYTYIAPKLLGDHQALSPVAHDIVTTIMNSHRLVFNQIQPIGGDFLVVSYPKEKL